MNATETRNALRKHCSACQRPMRPRCTPVENHPGTVLLEAKGMCSGCYVKHRAAVRAQAGDTPPRQAATARPVDGERLFYLLMERARFETGRSRRHVPASGARRIRLAITHQFLPLNQETAA